MYNIIFAKVLQFCNVDSSPGNDPKTFCTTIVCTCLWIETARPEKTAQIKNWFRKIATGMRCCAFHNRGHFDWQSHTVLWQEPSVARFSAWKDMNICKWHTFTLPLLLSVKIFTSKGHCVPKSGSCSQSMKEQSMTKNLGMTRNTIQQPNSIHVVGSPGLFHLLDLGWNPFFPKDRDSGSAEDL